MTCSLTFCSLSNNHISDEGACELAAALQMNQSLQELKLVPAIHVLFLRLCAMAVALIQVHTIIVYIIMAYGSTPYVGMGPKKWLPHWKYTNDTFEMSASTASMSHISNYQVLLWSTGPLTWLENIPKVPNRQVVKTGQSSIFLYFLLLSTFNQDSMKMAEAITMIETWKNTINHRVLHSPLIVLKERTRTSQR